MKKIITFTILCFLFIGVAGNLRAADINNIRATVYSWQEAWQSKDINQYKLFYSKKFKSDGFDYQGWMNKKEKFFAVPGAISIELFDLEINTQNNRIVVTFIQRYKSATLSDVGEKKLILIQSDDMYKIISEKFAILKEPTPSDEESLFGDQPYQTEPEQAKPPAPKYPASHTPVVKRPFSKSTINLAKLMRAPSLSKEIQVLTQKGEWQQYRSADGSEGWININMIDSDASFSQKKGSRFTPKAPEPKIKRPEPDGIQPVQDKPTSIAEKTVISQTSLEWLYVAPVSNSKRVERLTEGKAYLVVKKKGDWIGLRLAQGGVGWTRQKHTRSDASSAPLFPKTMSAASEPSKPPIPETKPEFISKPSDSSVLHHSQQKEARTVTRTVKLVTPKVSFARAYEKPTIDSMILFRLKQDKPYIQVETHGDWYRIEDDNGLTGWGHRTLFMKKIETAEVSVAIDPKEMKQSIPEISDLSPEPAPELNPAPSPDIPDPDTLAKAAPSSEPVLPETPSEPEDVLNPFAEDQEEKPETTESPQDEPPLFTEDDEVTVAPEDEPAIKQKDEQKAIKPVAPESSSDENASQLTIKDSNQLTPTVSLVRVYANPSIDARIMFWLTKGKTYTFTDKKDGWYHIQLADGRTGWAHQALYMDGSEAAKKKDKKESETVSIDKKLTSVVILGGAHEKPALDSKVIFRLEKGVTYTAEKKQGSWYLIKNNNGDTGWAHKSLFEVSAPLPIDDAKKKNIKRVNDIRFEAMPTGEEKVLFSLSGFYPPDVFLMEDSQSTLICDFSDIRSLTNLKPLIDIDQRFVKQIRTEMHNDALRVSIDLTPGKSYDVRQVFFKKENLFTLIFSTSDQ